MARREQTSVPNPVIIPRPSRDWDHSYMNNLVRALQQAFDTTSNPSLLKGGELYLNNLPTLGAGLREGYVFADSGVLKIVRANDVFADTFPITVSVGTVSVST